MERTPHYESYLKILEEELIPALGCTEPIAIALAAAKARDALGAVPERCRVDVSGNIIKNVKAVTVPNTGGLKGIEAAAAAGIAAGQADLELEVLSKITEADIPAISEPISFANVITALNTVRSTQPSEELWVLKPPFLFTKYA